MGLTQTICKGYGVIGFRLNQGESLLCGLLGGSFHNDNLGLEQAKYTYCKRLPYWGLGLPFNSHL